MEMIEWLKQQYNNLIFELFPILPSYLVRDCYKEFDEKYKEFRVMAENKRFVLYEHKGAEYILDTPNTELDFIEMLGDCLDEKEIVDLLNGFDGTIKDLSDDYEQLLKENKELKELVSEVDNELEIRDIVCGAGKFRLEEWGKHRYHQFYKGDEELEDETVVIMLMELEKENNELKKENEELKSELKIYRNVANCENCKYHNYDWFDDGDEFEVCEKGNDVTEGICEDWRKL